MKARMLFLAVMATLGLPVAAADRIPVVNENAIGSHWSVVPGTASTPAYPEAYASAQHQVCVTVGYLINADGHASDFALLKSWRDENNSRADGKFWSAFAGSASQALARQQFTPRQGAAAPVPTYTSATFAFGPGDSAATQAHCEIGDLAYRLFELRRDSRTGRMMTAGIFPRLDIDTNLRENVHQQRLAAREGYANRMILETSRQQQQEAQQRLEQQRQSQPPSSGP